MKNQPITTLRPESRAYQSPGTAVTRLIGRRMIHVVAAVLFLGIFVTALNVYELRGMQDGSSGLQHRESSVQEGERERGIKNEPVEVVRERRDAYESQHSERDDEPVVKQRDASQQADVKKDQNSHGPGPSSVKEVPGTNGKQPRKSNPNLTRKRAHLPISKRDQRPPEKRVKHHESYVKERLIGQSPTVQSDLRHPPSEHVGILNQPAQPIQMDVNPASVGNVGQEVESGYLDHVFAVFKRTGYKRGGSESDWDVIWSHEYPFTDPVLIPHLRAMKPHQKINHWPGGGYVTNKMSLATSDIHFVPQAFRLPDEKDELLRHAESNPRKMWVQKNNNHRGIKIKPLNQLTLTGQSFVQEYVENPFLIDGRKFDIGIYTVVTSINPLRMYMYEEEALFRYCSKPYHPFDQYDVDKYVVDEDYTPTWEMPSLKDTYNRLQYSHKDTWNHYVRSIGKDPSGVWRDIKTSLREVYLAREPLFVEQLQQYKSSRNFFELVRFDFVVDEDLNIFLMEVNMSPNMASGHTPPNKYMYEQVLFNLLNLVGVARSIPTTLEGSPDDQNSMMVNDRDIQIYPDICTSNTCRGTPSCANMYCKLCEHCLTPDWREHLKAAFLEHVGRRNFRRVCPVPMTQAEANNLKPPSDSSLSEANWLMDLWFRGKCHKDPAWCT
ncbi:Tubulin-tyrosine ligase [Branchiostoma belcheri]|nr:Tubulin-tyrosine ligase [Branchiostoma belcheri]